MSENPKLYYLQILNHHGTSIYEQQLDDIEIERSMIDSLSTIALGFKNMMDLSLSSVNYANFCIYFRKGINFIMVILSNQATNVEDLLNHMLEQMVHEDLMNKFAEFAKFDLPVQNNEILNSIRKIMVNLNFVNDLSEFKRNLQSSTSRF